MIRRIPVAILLVGALGLAAGVCVRSSAAAKKAGKTAPKKAKKPKPVPLWTPGAFMGEYAGRFNPDCGRPMPATGQVVGLGGQKYKVLLASKPTGTDKPVQIELSAVAKGTWMPLSGRVGRLSWSGMVADKRLKLGGKGMGGGVFELTYTVRKSPTEGAKPPAGAIVLLARTDGKASPGKWTNKSWKLLDGGVMQITKGDNFTVMKLRDFRMHLEFRLPYEPDAGEQGRANSGVYIHERYEVQILDSFGLAALASGCASLYKQTAPKTNESFPPLAWQTYDIIFRGPRLGPDGKLIAAPRITLRHNGVLVHDDRELPEPTGAARKQGHVEANRLKLQDHGHPVQFRNIWAVPPGGGADVHQVKEG